MKKLFILVALMAVLTGCAGRQTTFETIADDVVQVAAPRQREILLEIPKEAAEAVFKGESGDKLYVCEGYTLAVQTMQAGDLERTVRIISGYGQDELTVVHTCTGEFDRYDFVWSSAGEDGTQIGRAAVLDDGNYHYAVTCMASENAYDLADSGWDRIFGSFWLG